MCTPDIKEDLKDPLFADFFDFSTLDKDDPMRDTSRESKVGFWKIETGSDRILSSAGVRPKVYSLQYVTAKMLQDIEKKVKKLNIKMKRQKRKIICPRQFM